VLSPILPGDNMARTSEINSDHARDITWLDRFGRGYLTPVKCVGCMVLRASSVAEAVGLDIEGSPGRELCSPQRDQHRAENELEKRAKAAVDGTCQFVIEQDCWRLEMVEA
jgi:hypothetical protein